MAEPKNNWAIEIHGIQFFEKILRGHGNVGDFARNRDILFSFERGKGEPVTAVIVNEYILGLDAYHGIRAEFPEATWIVNLASWNCYTKDAKQAAVDDDVGLFLPEELTGALWSSNPARYQRRDEDGRPISYAAGEG
jgi:hypothetical protein